MKILAECGANGNLQDEVSTNFSTMSVVSERKKRKDDRLITFHLAFVKVGNY